MAVAVATRGANMDLNSFEIPPTPAPEAGTGDGAPVGGDVQDAAFVRRGAWPEPTDDAGAPADALPFILRAPAAAIVGTLAGGVDAVVVAPHVILTALRVTDAFCTDALATPLGAVRTLRHPAGRIVEVVHAPADTGPAWIEWTADGDAAIEVTWLLPHVASESGGTAGIRHDGAGLAWHPHAGSDIAWCTATPAAALGTRVEGPDVRARATFDLASGRTVRLTLGVARDGARAAAPASLDPASHRRARAARHARAAHERLRIDSPDAALDDAVRRAAVEASDLLFNLADVGRIAAASFAALDHHGRIDCGDAVVLALAALAVGDLDAAAATLRTLHAIQLETGAVPETVTLGGRPGTASLRATALFVVLAARAFAADGAHADAAARWPAVAAALEFLLHVGGDNPLVHAARAEASLLAEAIRAPGTAAAGAAPRVGLGRRATDEPPDLLTLVLAALDADAPAPLTDAALLLRFTARRLGFEPDAGHHRLRIAPDFPAEWTTCAATALRVGDATVSLHWERAGHEHRFTLEQDTGPVPLRLVFEPRLDARALDHASLDGETAELDPRHDGTALVVPVQLELDRPHTLVLRVAGE